MSSKRMVFIFFAKENNTEDRGLLGGVDLKTSFVF